VLEGETSMVDVGKHAEQSVEVPNWVSVVKFAHLQLEPIRLAMLQLPLIKCPGRDCLRADDLVVAAQCARYR
jgi:hypothetical protein